MASSLPLFLLDVDGVLNPYAAPACPPGYTEHAFFPGEDPVRLCAAHGPWLREMATRRPLTWIDDMLPPQARGWADRRRVPTLLIGIDPAEGLTRPVTEQAMQWADDHRAA